MKKWTQFAFILIVLFSAMSESQNHDSTFIRISQKNVLLYESPTTSSPILRRVFVGEVLKLVESVKTEDGEIWGKFALSDQQMGYIQETFYTQSKTLSMELWQPQEILRNKLPFSISLKGPSEYFGLGLQLRYMPFTRLGMNFGVGSVLDDGQAKGSVISFGVVSMLSGDNLSPFFETGSSTLTIDDTNSSLRISTFYVNVVWPRKNGHAFMRLIIV